MGKNLFKSGVAALATALPIVALVFISETLDQSDVYLTDFVHTQAGAVEVGIDQSWLSIAVVTITPINHNAQGKSALPEFNYNRTKGRDVVALIIGKGRAGWRYKPQLEQSEHEEGYLLAASPAMCDLAPKFLRRKISAFQSCEKPKYLEIIRQSPVFLETLGIEKPDGYSIAGRTNLTLPRKLGAAVSPGSQYRQASIFPDISAPKDVVEKIGADNPAVLEAVRLANIIYSNPVRTGRAGVSGSAFASLPIEERLRRVWSGESAFMCAGMRDMWIEMAASSERIEKVRHVGAYNYFPTLPDLVPYSHALAEFWVSEWEKWVAIDPWYGFMLSLNGELLNTSELVSLSDSDREAIKLVPVLPKVRQYTQNAKGARRLSIRSVEDAAPSMSSSWENGSRQFGYLDYFNVVDVSAPYSATPDN